MKTSKHNILNANQAVAQIAYKTNEVFPIYPITPASEMSELVEQWSAENKANIFDNIPTTFEMQSEAGVAGAMHGALQTGSLSSTFTASQVASLGGSTKKKNWRLQKLTHRECNSRDHAFSQEMTEGEAKQRNDHLSETKKRNIIKHSLRQ